MGLVRLFEQSKAPSGSSRSVRIVCAGLKDQPTFGSLDRVAHFERRPDWSPVSARFRFFSLKSMHSRRQAPPAACAGPRHELSRHRILQERRLGAQSPLQNQFEVRVCATGCAHWGNAGRLPAYAMRLFVQAELRAKPRSHGMAE